MPLQLLYGDITKIRCDAIVNAANSTLLGGGGVDGAIHRAAGPALLAECRTLGGCETGQSKLTKGYLLPADYVIHTVGPVWQGGHAGEPELLQSCYRTALEIAAAHGFERIAFPLISAGIYGYPKQAAQSVAVQTISAFLQTHDMTVLLVLFGDADERKRWYPQISRLLSERPQNAAAAPAAANSAAPKQFAGFTAAMRKAARCEEAVLCDAEAVCETAAYSPAPSLAKALGEIDESFTQMLLRKIDERGMTDAECYKKANIDRKLFSKIRSDPHYRPKKATALAFAVALELTAEETEELLRKAGYALSRSTPFDIIVSYFIGQGNYNIHEINEALFAFDQMLIGA
ncbi:MAG: O-acetyl-ADP-ribose deacetylase [Oscillospiraceae bacterium]|nr:O-acetyl-ADP-ribose deacetylase [Oscillospiraceae bacterium]